MVPSESDTTEYVTVNDWQPETGERQHPVQFSSDLYQKMIDHLRSELPNEGCGLIAFADDRPVKIYPGTNVLESQTRYRMDDEEVIRAVDEMESHGWWLGAIYHSHPTSPARPSMTDLEEANWPDALMVIVSLENDEPDVLAYQVRDQECESVPVIIDPPQPGMMNTLKAYFRRRLAWITRDIPTSPAPVGAHGSSQVDTADSEADAFHEQSAAIGILGGMGPAATVDLYDKIVKLTPAESDQEHIPVYVYADPRVPDRSEALLNEGADPKPWLLRGARKLSVMGADFIVIPCNTAHAFLESIEEDVDVDILSMIDAAADAVVDDYPDTRTVGLLATTGTIRSGIYQEALRKRGIATIVPDDESQRHDVMPSIRAVKANRRDASVTRRLAEAAESMASRGAHVILAACTEIPVVLRSDDLSLPLIDATEALARRAIQEAQSRNQARSEKAGDRIAAKSG